MSSKLFSKFKSRSKKPAGHQVAVAGSYSVISGLERINKEKKCDEKLNFEVIDDLAYGGRGPLRPLVKRFAVGSEAYILAVDILPEDNYLHGFYSIIISTMDFIVGLEEGKRKCVAVLLNHPTDDFGEIGSGYEDWIEKASKDHKLERFDVCANNQTGFSDVHNWISDQIIPKKVVAEANSKTVDTNSHGFRWLAKLSKAALTFGVRTSQVKE